MAAANIAFLSPAKSVSFAPSLITPDRAIVFCFPAFAFNMLVGRDPEKPPLRRVQRIDCVLLLMVQQAKHVYVGLARAV